jgi:microcystin-dependent protein
MPVNGKSRRSYRGAPVSNTLGVTLSVAATNITLAVAVSGWPTDAEPFFVVVDPGTAKEEKICVKYSSATTLTVVDPTVASTWGASAAGRGADNTVDRQHEQGAVIYPVFTATEANNANELVSKYANAGSVVYQGSGALGTATFTELAIGTAGQALKVNAGATAPEWGQIPTAGIADSAITLAKLATALQAYLVPVGTISAYAGVTAPTGWLLCDGTSTTGYTALAALVGATTPDMRGRFPIGDNVTLSLLGTGGSTTISEANLPSHAHANTATAATSVTVNSGGAHTPTASSVSAGSHSHTGTVDSNGSHVHLLNATFVTGSHNHDLLHDYLATGTAGASILGSGLDNAVQSGGSHAHTFTTGDAGSHSHTITVDAVAAHTHTASGSTTVTMSNASTGSGTAYFQPYLVVNYIIKHD